MDVKIDGYRLSINIVDLLDHLSDDDKRHIIDSLSCQDSIIGNVMDQVIDGCTEMGSYGGVTYDYAEPRTALDKARRAVALRAGEVAQSEITHLVDALKWAKASEDKNSRWAWRLYHDWNDYMRGDMTKRPQTAEPLKRDETLKYEVIKKGE